MATSNTSPEHVMARECNCLPSSCDAITQMLAAHATAAIFHFSQAMSGNPLLFGLCLAVVYSDLMVKGEAFTEMTRSSLKRRVIKTRSFLIVKMVHAGEERRGEERQGEERRGEEDSLAQRMARGPRSCRRVGQPNPVMAGYWRWLS